MNTDKHSNKTLLDLDQYKPLTEQIIGCAFKVSNTLGAGFLEKVYENALAHELRRNGMQVQQQVAMQVCYDSVIVGDYQADLLVDECILVELKAVKELDLIHMDQCLNYLKASGLKLCLLINFGTTRIQIKRIAN